MRTAEVLASRILFWGGVLSILLMGFGIWGAYELPKEEATKAPGVYTSVGQVARALARWPVEPLAIVAAGILLLLATPFASVVAVCVVFALGGDRRYAGVAALLVGALLVSFLFVGAPR